MRENDGSDRIDGEEGRDPPLDGEDVVAAYDQSHAGEAEDECVLESPQDADDLLAEVDIVNFLGRCSPGHVDLEEVAEDGLRDVQGDAAKEDGKKRDPGEVLEERAEEGVLAGAVAEDGESGVAEGGEDDDDGEVVILGEKLKNLPSNEEGKLIVIAEDFSWRDVTKPFRMDTKLL